MFPVVSMIGIGPEEPLVLDSIAGRVVIRHSTVDMFMYAVRLSIFCIFFSNNFEQYNSNPSVRVQG